jgi:prophage regulatory protein
LSQEVFSPVPKFLRLRQVKEILPPSTAEVYRRMALGTFPRPVSFGPKAVAWVESEIRDSAEALIAARDARLAARA